MPADFSKPVVSDDYAAVLAEIRDNDSALATMLDDVSPPNTPAGAKRWSTANLRWEKFDGSSWLELAAQYAISVQKLQGLTPGNADGNIPVSNGALNTNLNSEMLGGQPIEYFATAQALTDLALKEQADIDAVNAKIDSSTTGLSSKVSKAGDTMTGALMLKGPGTNIHFLQADGSSGPYMSWENTTNVIGFVNAAGNQWNLRTEDGGNTVFRGGVFAGSTLTAGNGAADKTVIYGGSMEIIRGGNPYIDFAHNSGQDFVWRIMMTGELSHQHSGGRNINFTSDANIYCDGRGFIWDAIYGKIGGAVCNHNTGLTEIGPMAGGDWAAAMDFGNPWVVVGIRCSYGNGDLTTGGTYLRAVQLRNY